MSIQACLCRQCYDLVSVQNRKINTNHEINYGWLVRIMCFYGEKNSVTRSLSSVKIHAHWIAATH
jgi:hypothetical protein